MYEKLQTYVKRKLEYNQKFRLKQGKIQTNDSLWVLKAKQCNDRNNVLSQSYMYQIDQKLNVIRYKEMKC